MVEISAGGGPHNAFVDGRIWPFERLDDGSVQITPDEDRQSTLTIPADQWAAIVAHVSWAGLTDARYSKAYRFHHGDEPAEQAAARQDWRAGL